MKEPSKAGGNTASETDIMKRSFEKETTRQKHEESRRSVDDQGTLMGREEDPNSYASQGNIPPGLPAEDAKEPGRATPGASPVDNRSGRPHDEKNRRNP